MSKLYLIAIMLMSLSGCMRFTTKENGNETQHYLGYTKVKYPKIILNDDMKLDIKETSGVGISAGDFGLNFGYFYNKIISTPGGNSIYIQVKNTEQLDRVINFLKEYRGDQICVEKE